MDDGYNPDDDIQQLEDDIREDEREEAAGRIQREVQLIDRETEPLGGEFYFSF